MKLRSLKELVREAIDIQDACSLSGLAIDFADVVQQVRVHLADQHPDKLVNTDDINRHPICQLWLYKMSDLAGIRAGLDKDAFSRAYHAARLMALPALQDPATEEQE